MPHVPEFEVDASAIINEALIKVQSGRLFFASLGHKFFFFIYVIDFSNKLTPNFLLSLSGAINWDFSWLHQLLPSIQHHSVVINLSCCCSHFSKYVFLSLSFVFSCCCCPDLSEAKRKILLRGPRTWSVSSCNNYLTVTLETSWHPLYFPSICQSKNKWAIQNRMEW